MNKSRCQTFFTMNIYQTERHMFGLQPWPGESRCLIMFKGRSMTQVYRPRELPFSQGSTLATFMPDFYIDI